MASRKKSYSLEEAVAIVTESDNDFSEADSSSESSDDDEACYRQSILFVDERFMTGNIMEYQVRRCQLIFTYSLTLAFGAFTCFAWKLQI